MSLELLNDINNPIGKVYYKMELKFREFTGTTSIPTGRDGTVVVNKKRKLYDVPDHVFRRLENGKIKYERWSKYLDNGAIYEKEILDYIKANKSNEVVLRNQVSGECKLIQVVQKEK